jgi:hypothetical protein
MGVHERSLYSGPSNVDAKNVHGSSTSEDPGFILFRYAARGSGDVYALWKTTTGPHTPTATRSPRLKPGPPTSRARSVRPESSRNFKS